MKKTILVMLALLMATGCAKTPSVSSDYLEISANDDVSVDITAETSETLPPPAFSFDDDIDDYRGTVGLVEFTKYMEEYSLNVSLAFSYDEDSDNYKLIFMDPQGDICIKNGDGNIVSQIVFNNPHVGGSLIVDDYKGITPEVLELDSGNLLIVRVPAGIKDDPDAQCLSVFYFDEGFVNYIGKQEYGGDFFPLIDGEITTDGDTFTVNEYDGAEREKRTVTYSVDFENILIKEVTE